MKKLLFIALILATFASCKKDDESAQPEEPQKQYNCVFDSNAKDISRTPNPAYNIYVDSVFVGMWPGCVLDSAYYDAVINDYENIEDTKVYLTLMPGKHSFRACKYSGYKLSYDFTIVKGDFIIPDTGLVSVFIDSNKWEMDDTIEPFKCGL